MEISILSLFINASFIVKAVIVILILASILSWMIIFERWLYNSKSKQEFTRFEDVFWSDIGVEKILNQSLINLQM